MGKRKVTPLETHYTEELIVLCDCPAPEHQIQFTYFVDDELPYIYVTFPLNRTKNILQRIWLGIRYILGYKCQYGHWDEILLNTEAVSRLEVYLTDFLHKIYG